MKWLYALFIIGLYSCSKYEDNRFSSFDGPDDKLIRITTQTGPVRVYINPDISQPWRIGIGHAINDWNNLDLKFHFILVDAEHDVEIRPYKLNDGFVAKAMRVDSIRYTIGEAIILNDQYVQTDSSKCRAIMTHEIGHIVGLEHINTRYSIMNPSVQAGDIFSQRDIQYIKLLFK